MILLICHGEILDQSNLNSNNTQNNIVTQSGTGHLSKYYIFQESKK